MLAGMGFSAPQARQALNETGGDMERAVDWLFSHPDAVGEFVTDSSVRDFQPPKITPNRTKSNSKPAETSAPGSDKLPANFQLQSIVCHKGSSIHAGHYVAFIRKAVAGETEPSWVLFNDEKVAKAADVDEMKKFAYLYFFRRV
jgi:ubiquitin carboxyl-terminal hydrolase 5/13